MKSTILGLFAVIAAANAGHVQYLQGPTTFVRTPSLDSAVIQSDSNNGAFSYSTVENHAYSPVVQSVSWFNSKFQENSNLFKFFQKYPVVRQIAYYPQIPQIYYPSHPGLNPVYSIYPGIYPSFAGVPGIHFPPQGFAPGVNPQNPIEVEDPADNRPNEDLQQGQQGNDEDTVSIDSA